MTFEKDTALGQNIYVQTLNHEQGFSEMGESFPKTFTIYVIFMLHYEQTLLF